ncbi:MAG: hypothetical protein R2744_01945 [Bacteroidales bacterium]
MFPGQCFRLGLLYFNDGENQKAIASYKGVIEKYPATPEARSAMTGLKTTFIEMNDVEGYFAYARTLGGGYADISASERDSLLIYQAENLYASGNWVTVQNRYSGITFPNFRGGVSD